MMVEQVHIGWGPVTVDEVANTVSFYTIQPYLGGQQVLKATLDTTGYSVETTWFRRMAADLEGSLYERPPSSYDKVQVALIPV